MVRRMSRTLTSQKSPRVYIAMDGPGSSSLEAMEAGAAGVSDPHQQHHHLPQRDKNHLATMNERMNHVPMIGNAHNKVVPAATAVTASAPHKRQMSQKAIEYNNNIHADNSGGGAAAAAGGGALGYEIGTLNDVKKGGGDVVHHATHQEEGLAHDGDDIVTVRGRRGRLIITVTDTGPGISSDNQKRLFKEIVQFNPEKLQAGGGSGFGLFISQGIIDLHDGCMGVYSQGEGHGATFSITIPMIRQAFAPRASITTLNLKLSEALRQSNKSEHSHHNDHRRMSQKSQNSYKVPSLNLSPPGGGSGDSNSRGHSVVVGVLDDGMGGDVLVDVDDFVFRGDVTNGTTGRSTGSGSRHHTVTFLSLGHTFQAFLIYLTTPASNHVLS